MFSRITSFLLVFVSSMFIASLSFASEGFVAWAKEAKISGHVRNYYFHREYDRTIPDNADYAMGVKLKIETAPWANMQIGAALYSAQDFGLSSEGKGSYSLLSVGSNGRQQGMNVVGEAYWKLKLDDTKLTIGRQVLKTPWMNSYEIRMTPITYEAINFKQKINENFHANLLYIHAAKPWTRTSFISISKFKGVSKEYGVAVAGLRYSKAGLKVQLWDYFMHNVYNSIYGRVDYNFKLNDDLTLLSNLRYGYMSDAQDSLAGKIDTYLGGVQLGLKGHGFTNIVAYSKIGKNDFTITFGHDMAVAGQIVPCNSSEQDGFMLQSSYNFGEIGIDGLSVLMRHIWFDEPGSGLNADQDETEFDLDIKYKFQGKLDNWSLRFRYAILDEKDEPQANDIKDYRAYITYSF